MRKLATSRLELLKDHLLNGGELFFGGKKIVQVELRESINDCVFARKESDKNNFEVNMFSLEFEFTTIASAEAYCRNIEKDGNESDWDFIDDYRKARNVINAEHQAETAFFKSHPELNP